MPNDRYEIVKCSGPDETAVELWDRALEPGGLAFEVIETDGAPGLTILGHGVTVPLDVFEAFLQEAKTYLRP